jgi:hypothetical protein
MKEKHDYKKILQNPEGIELDRPGRRLIFALLFLVLNTGLFSFLLVSFLLVVRQENPSGEAALSKRR